jgi:hypothetical protein
VKKLEWRFYSCCWISLQTSWLRKFFRCFPGATLCASILPISLTAPV